jgi:hypothetical protein
VVDECFDVLEEGTASVFRLGDSGSCVYWSGREERNVGYKRKLKEIWPIRGMGGESELARHPVGSVRALSSLCHCYD